MKTMKKCLLIFLSLCIALTPAVTVFADGDGSRPVSQVLETMQETDEYWQAYAVEAATGQPVLSAKSALLMDAKTGKVMFEYNADEKLPPASVTKIMTLLLVVEAIEAGDIGLDDTVTASTEASKMGGSQIYLKENEQMSVRDLLKATFVASANDAAFALAETVAGDEQTFISRMNARAKELGMQNTLFNNVTGLPGDDHYTTARDIAIMSRELLKHEMIYEYTTIWMDYLRDGATQLVNTNKLIRRYKGATGLKTGSTGEAGYCISATAERGGMSLIAVVLGSPSGSERFDDAKMLLDYGFLNYAHVTPELPKEIEPYAVEKGEQTQVDVTVGEAPSLLIEKGQEKLLEIKISEPVTLAAPVAAGDQVGQIDIVLGGETLATVPITAAQDVKERTWWFIFSNMIKSFFTV